MYDVFPVYVLQDFFGEKWNMQWCSNDMVITNDYLSYSKPVNHEPFLQILLKNVCPWNIIYNPLWGFDSFHLPPITFVWNLKKCNTYRTNLYAGWPFLIIIRADINFLGTWILNRSGILYSSKDRQGWEVPQPQHSEALWRASYKYIVQVRIRFYQKSTRGSTEGII